MSAYLKDAKTDVFSMRSRFLMLTFQELWHLCVGYILEPQIYSLSVGASSCQFGSKAGAQRELAHCCRFRAQLPVRHRGCDSGLCVCVLHEGMGPHHTPATAVASWGLM